MQLKEAFYWDVSKILELGRKYFGSGLYAPWRGAYCYGKVHFWNTLLYTSSFLLSIFLHLNSMEQDVWWGVRTIGDKATNVEQKSILLGKSSELNNFWRSSIHAKFRLAFIFLKSAQDYVKRLKFKESFIRGLIDFQFSTIWWDCSGKLAEAGIWVDEPRGREN